MITSLIVDDEKNGRENLKGMLTKHCADIQVLGVAKGVQDSVAQIKQLKPQLLFLDIEMKDGTGFDVLKQCTNIPVEVIFVTAYDNYGLNAIKSSAVDYILKPIAETQLIAAVDKAKAQILLKSDNVRLRNLIENQDKRTQDKRIALSFVDSIEFVEVKTIIRLEAEGSYTKIFTTEGYHMVSGSLKEYDDMLQPYGFIRTHQSHLVNPNVIKSFVKTDGGYLKLLNKEEVPVSRYRKSDVVEFLNNL